jgi:acetyltransferase-like isoleucine patch superfamily enzyme
MQLLEASAIAPGLLIAPGVEIPDDAEIEPYVTIHSGVVLGAGVRLGHGAVIGRPQRIDANSRSPRRPANEPTIIGAGCMIGGRATVVAGARIGARSTLADGVLIRETAVLCEEVMIGFGVGVARMTEIGFGTRIQSCTQIGPRTRIGEEVMIGPNVVFVGDPTLGRNGPGDDSPGISVGRRARIATGAIFSPPVQVGEEAVVGAASFVNADVAARTVVVGVPARFLRNVREDELLGNPARTEDGAGQAPPVDAPQTGARRRQ